jgi:serine-type D-Ala-D-Ala carboxypeptidase (penicillin-binding protein 5/6)
VKSERLRSQKPEARRSVIPACPGMAPLPFIIGLLLLFTFHLSLFTAAFAADTGDIKSKAAVVLDATTGRVLYAKNPDLKLLPASTTKLMTALVVLERARLSDVVTASKKAAGQPATRVGLKPGDRFTVENLLYAALMKSANDAAVALAEAAGGTEDRFVELMNQKAIAIGAVDTHYINANGLPGPGQYITAYDLAKIMREAIKHPVLKEILGTRVTEVSNEKGRQIAIRNTNKLLWSDEDVLGGKTGYTRQARHCFVCAGERDKDTIIVALLGEPYRDLLWKESEILMAFGARVLNKAEEPVIYLTKNEYSAAKATRASYTEESGAAGDGANVPKKKAKRKKIRTRHRIAHKGHAKAVRALAKKIQKDNQKDKKVLAKNEADSKTKHRKSSRRRAGKHRARKKMIAKKEENATKG